MTTLYIFLLLLGLTAGWWGGYTFGWHMRGEQEEINRERGTHVAPTEIPAIDPQSKLWDDLEEAMQRHPAGKGRDTPPELRLVEGEES